MNKIKSICKNLIFKYHISKRLWQVFRAITLLRIKSFRSLFLKVSKNDICLDLGANIGNASLVMWLRGVKKIYALEPNIEAYNALKKNVSGIKNIFTLNKAISNKTSRQNLYLHKSIRMKNDSKILRLSQASSLMSEKNNLGECFFEVETITLRDLFAEKGFKPNIIKCDIEGGEYLIYDQLIEYSTLSKVKKIFVECHAKKYSQFTNEHQKFIELIKKNNLDNIIDTSWH